MSADDFVSKARGSVLWSILIQYVLRFGQILLTLVLVRLITPEEYGQYAVVNSVIVFSALFSVQVLTQYLPKVTRDHAKYDNTVFTVGVGLQLLCVCVLVASGFVVRCFDEYAELSAYLFWMCGVPVLNLPRLLHATRLSRALDYQRERSLRVIAFLSVAVTAIPLAYSGHGVEALLAGAYLNAVPYTVDLFFVRRWMPRLSIDSGCLRRVASFGLQRFVANAAGSLRPLLENLALSSFMGFAALGQYNRSKGMAQLIVQDPVRPVGTVLYPIFGQIQGSARRVSDVGDLALFSYLVLVLPAAGFSAVYAQQLVLLIFGPQWAQAAHLLPLMSAFVSLATMTHLLTMMSLVKNLHKSITRLELLSLLGAVALMVHVLPNTISGYLAGLCLVQAVVVARLVHLLVRSGALDGPRTIRTVLTVLTMAAVTTGSSAIAKLWVGDWHPVLLLTVGGGVHCLAAVIWLRAVIPARLLRLLQQLPKTSGVISLLRLQPTAR